MRKLVSLILALTLALSLSVTAFAAAPDATLTGGSRSENVDVTVTYQNDTMTPTVYSVDVTWQEMNFQYVEAGTMLWNPETHAYEHQTTGVWESKTANIQVTNHSNAPVEVAVSYAAEENTGVTGTITNSNFTLESAEGKAFNEADAKTATLTISGVPADKTAENLKVGTVTVKFE